MRSPGLGRNSYLYALGALCAFWLGGETSIAAPVLHNMEHDLFSAGWLMEYSMGPNGCAMARESYTWRVHGFGSNVNSESGPSGILGIDEGNALIEMLERPARWSRTRDSSQAPERLFLSWALYCLITSG